MKLVLLLLAVLVFLAAAVTAQAQVVHRAHAGGPDACDSFGLPPGCDANFSLNALEFADGSVGGNFTDRFPGGDGFHAKIDCLSIAGNDAWVSGVITRGAIGDFDLTGFPVATRVRDNGTSKNDPADELSFSWIGDPTPCYFQIDYDLVPVPQGQVVVE